MRIGYWTTDVVNFCLARDLAEVIGVSVDWVFFKDGDEAGRWDAAIYDLDFMPSTERERALAGLRAGQAERPAAVHSYGLDDEVIQDLACRNVIVERRLDELLVGRLYAAVQAARMTTSSDGMGRPAAMAAVTAAPAGA